MYYTQYILFLVYTLLSCLVAIIVMMPDFTTVFLSDGDKSPTPSTSNLTPTTDEQGSHSESHTSRSLSHHSPKAILFISTILDVSLLISVAGFLMLHINLIRNNKTTIEMFESHKSIPNSKVNDHSKSSTINNGIPHKNSSSKSEFMHNFEEVFGSDPCFWCLPIQSVKDQPSMRKSSLLHPKPYLRTNDVYSELIGSMSSKKSNVNSGKSPTDGNIAHNRQVVDLL